MNRLEHRPPLEKINFKNPSFFSLKMALCFFAATNTEQRREPYGGFSFLIGCLHRTIVWFSLFTGLFPEARQILYFSPRNVPQCTSCCSRTTIYFYFTAMSRRNIKRFLKGSSLTVLLLLSTLIVIFFHHNGKKYRDSAQYGPVCSRTIFLTKLWVSEVV